MPLMALAKLFLTSALICETEKMTQVEIAMDTSEIVKIHLRDAALAAAILSQKLMMAHLQIFSNDLCLGGGVLHLIHGSSGGHGSP